MSWFIFLAFSLREPLVPLPSLTPLRTVLLLFLSLFNTQNLLPVFPSPSSFFPSHSCPCILLRRLHLHQGHTIHGYDTNTYAPFHNSTQCIFLHVHALEIQTYPMVPKPKNRSHENKASMGLGKPHQLLPARTVQSYYTDLSCVWMIQFWMLYDIRMKINKLNKYQTSGL